MSSNRMAAQRGQVLLIEFIERLLSRLWEAAIAIGATAQNFKARLICRIRGE